MERGNPVENGAISLQVVAKKAGCRTPKMVGLRENKLSAKYLLISNVVKDFAIA